jgi:uncharacterized protein (TIGR03083 family)
MITDLLDVAHIAPLDHDQAMVLAGEEYERLLAVVDGLNQEDWTRPTDCPGWDVKAVVSHLLGFMKGNADPAEAARQFAVASRIAQEQNVLRLDAQTALQVREHAHLSPAELAAEVHEWAPRALAGRAAAPAEVRAASFPTGLPGEGDWSRGYLIDRVLTRDVWMHRVDVCRATGQSLALTAEHDGRLIADVVADWAARHGRAFTLRLDGPAEGTFTAGQGGPGIRLDAVEFCRILSGRGSTDGLLATPVPF